MTTTQEGAVATGGDRSPAPKDPKASAGSLRSRISPASLWRTVGPIAVFVLLLLVVSALNPSFLGGGGVTILATQAAAILFVALGQSAVLHVGSIDLSNASIGLLAAMVLALTLGSLGPIAIVLAIAVATGVGALNGVVFAVTQIPSFALTLGTLGVLQAAALVLSNATTVYVTGNTDLLAWMFGSAIAGVPAAFILGIVLAVAFWAVLRFTRVGHGLTAVGLNESGAIFAGRRNRLLKTLAFALSGFFAGFAGLVIIAQAGAASSFGVGSDLLLPAIAAAILGGTAITGGVTNPITVVFGALTTALLPIGIATVGINAQAQSLAYGFVIILIVALTATRSRHAIVK